MRFRTNLREVKDCANDPELIFLLTGNKSIWNGIIDSHNFKSPEDFRVFVVVLAWGTSLRSSADDPAD